MQDFNSVGINPALIFVAMVVSEAALKTSSDLKEATHLSSLSACVAGLFLEEPHMDWAQSWQRMRNHGHDSA